MKIIHKPWGREEWIELNDRYCYKRIYINKGHKTSFQYHNIKKETNYIISGEAEVWLENDQGIIEKTIMKAGDFFNVEPPKKHRVIALTDIILQEVSTPEVDDVVRIEDDTNRGDGKIEDEHLNPAVLILTAGTGSRLGNLTEKTNKALIPVNNRAIISYIIDKFPSTYDFIITKGYKGDIIEEYCKIAFPNHNFIFVDIDKFEGEGTGPGYSSIQCERYLQRPFYLITGDCIIDDPLPPIDYNWLGYSLTSTPENYSTIEIDSFNNIKSFKNKSKEGYNNAFIGIGAIWNYEIFWKELKQKMINGEIVPAFENIEAYPTFKARHFNWFDAGNIDGLSEVKKHLNDNPLSLSKINHEFIYKENNKIIKFSDNSQSLLNRKKRSKYLKNLIPNNLKFTKYFMVYDWVNGETLYDLDSPLIYQKFLGFFSSRLISVCSPDIAAIHDFYINKTNKRKEMFLSRFSQDFYEKKFIINGVEYDSMKNIFEKIDFKELENTFFYKEFHGDLQFANIIFNEEDEKFVYIDWRENFSDLTESGDLFYDLGKLYGGVIMPYNLMKDESTIELIEKDNVITYNYEIPLSLVNFKRKFEEWAGEFGFALPHIKLITSLIYLNMSPLHDEKFSKLLWYKSIEMLSENL